MRGEQPDGPATPPGVSATARRAGILLREVITGACRYCGPEAVVRRTVANGKVGILVYHDPSPLRLEKHLRYLSKRYSFVTLAQLAAALEEGDWSSIPPRALVLTFDDGHRGNRDLLPLFERYGVRPTIYLCSGVVLGDGRFWFREPGVDPEPLKLMSPAERTTEVAAAVAGGRPAGRYALTVAEVREMASAVDFGSHTVSHPILPLCSPAEAEDEITRSRTEVAEIANARCDHFSFPNGDFTARDTALIRRAGYATARTTEIGWNGPGADPVRLRILSLADHATVNVLAAHLSGALAVKRFLPSLRHRRRLAARATAAADESS